MARVSGVDIPREKRVEVALTYVFGIGRTRSKEILAATGVNPNTRVRDLAEEDLVKIREHVDANLRTEGDLRREVQANIRRKVEIGCYQGIRHRRGLPVHGQRTSTNARTRKGPRRAIAGKKKPGRSSPQRTHCGPPVSRNPQQPAVFAVGPITSLSIWSQDMLRVVRAQPEGASQGKEERRSRPRAHQEHVQQHHRLDHGPLGQRDLLGPPPATSASRARASPPPSPRRWPPSRPPAARRSTACARSTSSSRVPAPAVRPRSAPSRPPASRSVRSGRHPDAAQRLPSAEASSRLTRYGR